MLAAFLLLGAKVELEVRVADVSVTVFTKPDAAAAVRGRTAAGAAFYVVGPAEGSGCDQGWVEVEAQGFVCLDGTRVTKDKPVIQPVLLEFDPPEPEEYESYIVDGQYDHKDKEFIVPVIYGRRWKRFEGRLWESVEAYTRGEPSIGTMTGKTGERLGFVGLEDTRKGGPVLKRADGQVAPLDEVYIYPVTRFAGWNLALDPLPPDRLPAVAISYAGTPIHEAWRKDSAVVTMVPYHTLLEIGDSPDPTGQWWPVLNGKKVIGWVDDQTGVRRPVPSPGRPDGIGDDELWIDVALEQQALSLWRGETMVYFTVISSGVVDHETPEGQFRVLSMSALADMQSRPDADDWYRVEDVPWTIAFKRRYALHAAYWHWGMGRPASHGCINLAPRDAAHLFSVLEPRIPEGWHSISAKAGEGTLIRIRAVPDED